jgi:hypothetical protein
VHVRHHLSLLASWSAALLVSTVPVGSAVLTVPWIRVLCAGGRQFFVRLEPQRARIMLEGRQFELRRKPSALGRHYRGQAATLIIGGNFVAFVPRNDPDWQDCRIADAAEDKR